jgi:hypothetical protein
MERIKIGIVILAVIFSGYIGKYVFGFDERTYWIVVSVIVSAFVLYDELQQIKHKLDSILERENARGISA